VNRAVPVRRGGHVPAATALCAAALAMGTVGLYMLATGGAGIS
jgi:hypothetical protein